MRITKKNLTDVNPCVVKMFNNMNNFNLWFRLYMRQIDAFILNRGQTRLISPYTESQTHITWLQPNIG